MTAITRWIRRHDRGQSVMEFAILTPVLLVLALGVSEFGYLLLDQHVITKLAREGSNLISRNTTLQDATTVLQTIESRPVDFSTGSKVIFSVIKRGATTGTANYNQLILYQRHEYGALSAPSKILTAGGGSFGGAPDYIAANSDNNTSLRVTNVPNDLIPSPGGMIYVTEVYTTHSMVTPLSGFGVLVPSVLYSVAYF
jgi:TadE-like protein